MRSAFCVLVFGVGVAFTATLARSADAGPQKKGTGQPAPQAAADRLTGEAQAAELAGDNVRRDELLSQALKEDPNCRAARWQAGFVSVDGKWLTIAEAVKKFSADPNLAAYRRLRDQAADAGLFTRGASDGAVGNTDAARATVRSTSVKQQRPDALSPAGLAAHIELARWCRSKQLSDEERAHWTQVLLEDSANSEAKARLGMRLFMGALTTNAQIEAIKKQHADEEKQLADWKTTVSRWRKALDAGSNTEVDRAAREIEQFSDAAIIPALEWGVLTDTPKPPANRELATRFQRQAISLFGRLPQQRATYSLTGYSVLSPQKELRGLAAEQLKKRPMYDFVPLLLSGLANPICFDYAMTFDPTLGVANYHAFASQEDRDAVHQVEYDKTSTGLLPRAHGGHFWGNVRLESIDRTGRVPTMKTRLAPYDFTMVAWVPGPTRWSDVPGALALARQSSIIRTSLEGRNSSIAEMNTRVDAVLRQVAPEEPLALSGDDDATAIPDAAVANSSSEPSTADRWWNWWARYNELPISPKQTILTRYSTSSDQRFKDDFGNYYNPSASTHSCFAAGTIVMTALGPVPIEKLRIGDRVLAQDANTGELAYKPVLATSKSPPAKLLRVETSHGALRLTLGHPFWIVGKGWRMAKELAVGDQVHSLHGGTVVRAIESEPAELVYNLNVADFGTYFVGDGEMLVHDFSTRLPTRAVLPGLVAVEK